MKIWVVQSKENYNQLKKGQPIVLSEDKINLSDSSFKRAYNWYIREAKKRIPSWGEAYPIWGWLKRPDLRELRHIKDPNLPRKNQWVLLELDIPKEEVLISDFNLWIYITNNEYIALSDEDLQIFKTIPPSPEKAKAIKDSWVRCLKDEKAPFSKKFKKPALWQGGLAIIKKEHLVKATPFTALNSSILAK